jgi:hypothetical protein
MKRASGRLRAVGLAGRLDRMRQALEDLAAFTRVLDEAAFRREERTCPSRRRQRPDSRLHSTGPRSHNSRAPNVRVIFVYFPSYRRK